MARLVTGRRLVVVLALVGTVLLPSPVVAATGAPPVTQPDVVQARADEPSVLEVLDNDSDPDGDVLAVCRVADAPPGLEAELYEGQLFVYPSRPGTYSFTYYACDNSYLTAGTVTVRVAKPRPVVDVVPTRRPGTYRIINTFRHQSFRCEWFVDDETEPVGHRRVAPRSSVVVRADADAEYVEFRCTGSHGVYEAGFVFDEPE